jgi:hypothetical protein
MDRCGREVVEHGVAHGGVQAAGVRRNPLQAHSDGRSHVGMLAGRMDSRFQPMRTDRSRMTARVVPLRSDEASDARVGGLAVERLALLRELSDRMWALTGRPVPTYTRATIPVKVTTLAEQ